jgi:hypothetical protein
MLGGVALEQLVEALGMKDRQNAVRDGLDAIEAKGKEIKALNAEKLAKIQEQLENMKSKGILDGFLKAFKWIGMVLGAIASVAAIAAGAVTGNPLLIAGGIVALTMSVNAMVSEGTDGKVSIGAGVAALAEKCGASEDVARWIGFGMETAITLVGAGISIGGGVAQLGSAVATAAAKTVNMVSLGLNIAQGVTTVGQGAAQITGAVYDYRIAQAKADMKDLEAILARIQQAMENEESFLESVMERVQDLFGKVTDIVKGNAEAQTAVLTGQAPSMA